MSGAIGGKVLAEFDSPSGRLFERRRQPGALRAATSNRLPILVVAGWMIVTGCGKLESVPTNSTLAEPRDRGEVVAIESENAAPEGTDQAPRVVLARRADDGTLSPIAGEYVDAVRFREGMVAVTPDLRLEFVRSDGSRSVLAHEVDGLPAQASDGSLVYAARFGEVVEIHWVTVAGSNRRLASLRGSATRLAPQSDGSVVFVGASSGGVVGVWVADSNGARCVTNCSLRAGGPWGDAYRPPPGDAEKMRITPTQVEWQTGDGTWESAPLETEARQ